MYKLLHFAAIDESISEYESFLDFEKSYQEGGCDGIEIICCGDYDRKIIRDERVIGVHLPFYSDWMNFWKGDIHALNKEFGHKAIWEQFYGGDHQDVLIDFYRRGLDYAHEIDAKYVVFHVNHSTLNEVFTYQQQYTDKEVVDAAAQIINHLLKNQNYHFDFLMENLWLSGLNFKDVSITERLINQVEYTHKGFMLDTGHLMNVNRNLQTEKEGFAYINQILDQHKHLRKYFKGIHLHKSVSGSYVKDVLTQGRRCQGKDYYERLKDAYMHLHLVDRHEVTENIEARKVIEKVNPKYLVYEFRSQNRKDREDKLWQQSKIWK